jgi:hypothetical protein
LLVFIELDTFLSKQPLAQDKKFTVAALKLIVWKMTNPPNDYYGISTQRSHLAGQLAQCKANNILFSNTILPIALIVFCTSNDLRQFAKAVVIR